MNTTPRLPRLSRTTVRVAPALALAVTAGVLAAGPATAVTDQTQWSYSFTTPGTYTVTVPTVATSVELAAAGASGGSGGDSARAPGGPGQYGHVYDYTEPVAAGAALHPGQTLTIMVGGRGTDGAGGHGGAQAGNGGSGGGASAVIDDSGTLVLVASGGSGGGGAGALTHAYGGSYGTDGFGGDDQGTGGAGGAIGQHRTCGPNDVTGYLTAPTAGQDAADPLSGGGGGGGGGACPGDGGQAGSDGGGGGAGGIGGDVSDTTAPITFPATVQSGDNGAVRLVFTVNANPTGATFTSPDHGTITSDQVTFSQQVQAVAAPGEAITYSLTGAPDWVSIDPQSGLLTAQGFRPAGAKGDYHFGIVAAADEGTRQSMVTQDFTLTLTQAPVFVDPGPFSVYAGTPFGVRFATTSFPAATYQLSGNVPSWLTINHTNGLMGGNPPLGSQGSSYTVAVVAGNGVDPQVSRILQIHVLDPLLQITTSTLPHGIDGKPYSQTLKATGATGSITWSLAHGSLPEGLTLSPGGVISGTPVYQPGAGGFDFEVKATDPAATPQEVVAFLTIVVDPAPAVPPVSCTVPATLSATKGVQFSRQLSASGGTTPYRWALAAGTHLPSGLTLTTGGLVSGTPTTTGTTHTGFTVTDAHGSTGTCSASIVVAAPPLKVTGASTLRPTHGKSYSHTLSASGGTGTRHWALQSGSTLPTGLHLSTTGVISGKPTAKGSRTVTVVVTDSARPAQRVTARLTITVS